MAAHRDKKGTLRVEMTISLFFFSVRGLEMLNSVGGTQGGCGLYLLDNSTGLRRLYAGPPPPAPRSVSEASAVATN